MRHERGLSSDCLASERMSSWSFHEYNEAGLQKQANHAILKTYTLRSSHIDSAMNSIFANLTALAVLSALASTDGIASEERAVKSLLETRHENVVVQKWDLSCGAAAITTLLNHQNGEKLTEKEVAVALMGREEYLQNPDLLRAREGFSLLDLKRYVDSRGYEGKGYGRLQMKDLGAKAPFIVPISLNGYNHFVIVRGVRGDRVLLADPAWGNRTVRMDNFMNSWIEFPDVGRVGFVVIKHGPNGAANQLQPRDEDFVMLR